ncbi:MAG TPA: hypothetical protein VD884_07290 [Ohtaekwangia sp.]|nr:hypothetical protein [Ohtaekwangia sp.]
MKITIADIGEILEEANKGEISFRLENLVAIGFRWAMVGYEGRPAPGQMRLRRAEIDDGIQGTLQFVEEVPEKLRFLGLEEDEATVTNAAEHLKSLHVMRKDWLERGEADDIITAITGLSDAICRHYPESDFTAWFNSRFERAE